MTWLEIEVALANGRLNDKECKVSIHGRSSWMKSIQYLHAEYIWIYSEIWKQSYFLAIVGRTMHRILSTYSGGIMKFRKKVCFCIFVCKIRRRSIVSILNRVATMFCPNLNRKKVFISFISQNTFFSRVSLAFHLLFLKNCLRRYIPSQCDTEIFSLFQFP